MSLCSLAICNLRIIECMELEFSSGLNFIYGKNAAGKTTILEAIHLLSTTRSFRTRKFSDYLRKGEGLVQVNGKVQWGSRQIPIGLRRNDAAIDMRADGAPLQRASALASWLPLQLIYSDSYLLVTGGPRLRRAFLDWGLFHMEPPFLQMWQRYEHTLRQRNTLLKQKKHRNSELMRLLKPWDHELSNVALQIHKLREAYVRQISEILPSFVEKTVGQHTFTLSYYPGWDTEKTLEHVLEQNLGQDLSRGFTHYGIHRCELFLKFDEHDARKILSRGQQKMAVILLSLAQIRLLQTKAKRTCLVLIDDLPAELDKEHRRNVLSLVRSMPVQVFVTAIDPESIVFDYWDTKKMFHVEQGYLREVL